MNKKFDDVLADKKGKYMCPTHPEIQRDEAGICPVCGMDLVPEEPESEITEETSSQ